MSAIDDRQRSINAKIERLRKRLKDQQQKTRATEDDVRVLTGVVSGLLDLMADEL